MSADATPGGPGTPPSPTDLSDVGSRAIENATFQEGILREREAAWETDSAPRPLTRAQVEELARSIQLLLDRIHADELAASTATTYRMEGAVVALRAALGEQSGVLEDLLREPD